MGTTGISKYNSLIINTMLNTVPTVVCVAIAAISFGIFIQLAIMCKLKSFGSPYINPYILGKNKRSISSYFIPPIWKRERTSSFVHAQKKFSQQKISMVWRKK